LPLILIKVSENLNKVAQNNKKKKQSDYQNLVSQNQTRPKITFIFLPNKTTDSFVKTHTKNRDNTKKFLGNSHWKTEHLHAEAQIHTHTHTHKSL